MNIAQADIVFLRYTYTWYLLPNTAEMCCQNWLYRTCGTSLPRSATTLRRNSSSVTGKTTMCICLSIIRPKYPSLSWSTVSRVYPVAVCETFALKLRVGIAKVSFGRRLILPLHVVVRRSILSANMSKRSEPTKNRASAVAPYIPALKDEVLRRVPISCLMLQAFLLQQLSSGTGFGLIHFLAQSLHIKETRMVTPQKGDQVRW